MACKPGSVPVAGRWPFLWDARYRTPRATDPDGDAETHPAIAGQPSLLGLAPGGVCRADLVAEAAVRSYRTVSPLRNRRILSPTKHAVCSLWHCPWGRPRRALPGTVFPWSPDFPRRTVARPPRPSGHLARP